MIKAVVSATLIGLAAIATANSKPVVDDRHAVTTFFHEEKGYHVVTVDLKRGGFAPTVSYRSRLTDPWKIIGQHQPVVAITGTFFAFENQKPVAEVVVDGVQVAQGKRGSCLAVDWDGRVSIFDVGVGNDVDYAPYRHVLRGMVRIVNGKQVSPAPWDQGFRDRGIWSKAKRTAVGITADNKLLFVSTRQRVLLSELGRAMVSRGAVDAVSLDGGGSSMLYYMGDMRISPSRNLSTLFMIENRSPYDTLYQARQHQLASSPTSRTVVPRQ